MRRALVLLILLPALSGAAIWLTCWHDMAALSARMEAAASVVQTSHRHVADESGGIGRPVLAIHGAGGGHDQGRLPAEAFLPEGTRRIAPSRFGFPDAPLPAGPSTAAAQADAFAELLDNLGTVRVAVLAMSGGMPPALLFALRHPDRTRALILLSLAPCAPRTAETQDLPVPMWLHGALFAADLPSWAVQRLPPPALAPVFDARPELIAQLTDGEAGFLDAMIADVLPVTGRRAGLASEGAAIAPAIDPGRIAVPAMILPARDDRITPLSTAAFTAGRIPGATFPAFETGGHLLLGHHAGVRRGIAGFHGELPSP